VAVPAVVPRRCTVIVAAPLPSLTEKLGALNWNTGRRLNVAVTERSPSIDTTQSPVPPQPPLQPASHEVAPGEAVSVTIWPGSYWTLHDAPQARPSGPVTVPVPLPAFVTVSP
jgi:hypothetical protein